MLTKLATFRGVSSEGEPLARIFRPGDSITKIAGEMMPKIREWLSSYKTDPNKIAVLVNAMGASEYWGQNVNGDIFPENALVHDCRNHPSDQHPVDDFTGKIIPPYGYWTFLQAFSYVHHRNKDPNRAFGKVVLAVWNPRMHRVELVILLDKQLALQNGAQHVVDRILAGEFPDCSMGCVPSDTLITMADGTRKPIEEIIEGDLVLTHRGRARKVTKIHKRHYKGDLYTVRAEAHEPLRCTRDHPFLTVLDSEVKTTDSYRRWKDDTTIIKTDWTHAKCLEGVHLLEPVLDPQCALTPDRKIFSDGISEFVVVPIREYDSIYDELDVFNLEVEEDGSYVASGLVMHNCKVPYDICTCCSHKSKTRNDYCSCIRYIGMGKILDDGRRIGVINIHPRFFDISFVFIGADKTAKVMCKLASNSPESLWVPQSVLDADQIYKTACGAKDCRDCKGGCKVKAASMDEQEATRLLMSLAKPKKPYTRGPLDMPNNLDFVIDEEMKNLAKKAPQPRLYFGREDDQQREGKRSIVDGILRTNSNINESDEFPQPLTPSRGKTAYASVAKETGLGAFIGAVGAAAGVGALSLLKSRGKFSPRVLKDIAEGALEGSIAGGATGAVSEALRKKRTVVIRRIKGQHKTAAAAVSSFKMDPPPSPNRKDYPFVGTIDFRGIKIGVENAPGTWRTGKGWKTFMKYPYGEFLANAMGHDKDKLDVYVGPHTDAPNVYVVHQNKVSGEGAGQYDEDKVMLGFRSPEEAKAAYLAHYNNEKFFRSITTMSFSLFKKALLREEFEGDKVANLKDMLEKDASDLRLEDLFSGTKLQRRERTWRDAVTGKEVKVLGSGINKTASKKKIAMPSAHDLLKISAEKWADIIKEIGPSKAVGKVSPLLSASEETLPPELLNSMGESGVGKGLSTASLMGMVLKPEEFQRILLAAMGHQGFADKMDESGSVFTPQEGETAPCDPLESDQFSPGLMSKLMPHLSEKSYFGPVVRRRIIQIILSKPEEATPQKEVTSPLLSKVGSAYNWYRREQMKLAGDAMRLVPSIPKLHAGLYGLDEVGLFDKTAGWLTPKTLAVLLGAIPLTLMYSAHQRGKEMRGEEIGLLNQLIADHPWLATLGTSAALREILKTPQAQSAVDEILAAGQRVWKGKVSPQPEL